MFRFAIRDVLWLTVVVALVIALLLQARNAHHAGWEAQNRMLENEYLTHKVLALEEKLYGTADHPKSSQPPPTVSRP